MFEEERKMNKDNNLLGKFNLEGIPPSLRGVPNIEVTIDTDANGILNVNAVEKSEGISNNIQIINEKGRLSKEDFEKLVQQAEQFKEEDEKVCKKVESRNTLDSLIYQGKQSANDEKLMNKRHNANKFEVERELSRTSPTLNGQQSDSLSLIHI